MFCIDLDKYGLGYILGYFYTNSSGHPAFVLPPHVIPNKCDQSFCEKIAQFGPKIAQFGSKITQFGSKIAPFWFKNRPKGLYPKKFKK
jgi:hypothetical protein